MNRRQFTKYALLAGSFASIFRTAKAQESEPIELRKNQAKARSDKAHNAFMATKNVKMMGEEKIAMLLYSGCYAPDLINPQFIFNTMMGSKIYLISPDETLNPVNASGVSIVPTHTQSQCPDNLDILFVPGGATGTLNAMKNQAFIEFIKNKAATAKYITSVCTGSLLLGQAGLLNGKKATTHWSTMDVLAKLGAIATKERVVWDGKLITGSGVTAGLDFGLEIVAVLRGKEYAQVIQLEMEYAPTPPFNAGTPDSAPPFIHDTVKGIFAPLILEMELAIKTNLDPA